MKNINQFFPPASYTNQVYYLRLLPIVTDKNRKMIKIQHEPHNEVHLCCMDIFLKSFEINLFHYGNYLIRII